MMLSNKAKYGLKALAYLTRNPDRSVQSAEIAQFQNVPKKFLDAILRELKTRGVLISKKGKGGGYQLSRPPQHIMVGEVIRILDGPLEPISCVSLTAYRRCGDCSDETKCCVRAVMKNVRDAISSVVDSCNLIQMLDAPFIEPEPVLTYDI